MFEKRFFKLFFLFLILPCCLTQNVFGKTASINPQQELEKGLNFYNQAKYDSAAYWLSEYLKKNPNGSVSPQYVDAISKLSNSYCLLNDYKNAGKISREIVLLTKSKQCDNNLKNELYLAIGYYHYMKGEFSEATKYFNQVYESDNTNYKKCLYFLGSSSVALGDEKNALRYFNELLVTSPEIFVHYHNNITPDLLRICEQAKRQENNRILKQVELFADIIIAKKLLTDSSNHMYARYYLALIYIVIENYPVAIDMLKKAEKQFRFQNDIRSKEILISIKYTLGKCYSAQNDFEKAEKYFHQSEMLINESNNVSNKIKLSFWMLYSHNAIRVKKYANALMLLDSAGNYLNQISNDDLSNYYNSKGIALKHLKRLNEAESSYLIAIEARKSVSEIHFQNLSRDYQNYSELLSLMGRHSEAVAMGRESCRIITSLMGERSGSSSIAFSSLAKIYSDCGRWAESMAMYNKALLGVTTASHFPNRLFPDASTVTYAPGFIKALTGKAGLLYKMAAGTKEHDTDFMVLSLLCYLESLKAMERVRSGFQFEEGKMRAAEIERETYNHAAIVAAELYRLTGQDFYIDIFFNISERAKSVVLLERISLHAEAGNKFTTLFGADLKLRKEIAGYENYHSKIQYDDAVLLAAIKKHLFRLYEIQEWFYEELKDKFPEYYSTWVKPQYAGIKEVQSQLKDSECMVSYFKTDTVLFSVVINRNKTFLYTQKIGPVFETLVAGLRSELHKQNCSSLGISDYVSFVNKSDSLYRILLRPAENQIQNNHIIISSDALLHFLPFEVLLKHKPAKMDMRYHTLNYLIRENAVSYTSSASLYCRLHSAGSKHAAGVSVFAPVYSQCGGEVCDVVKKYELLELDTGKADVTFLKNEMNAAMFTGAEASESKFKETVANTGISHLTLHGMVNEDHPEQSMLVFGCGGGTDDGLLHAWEIYNLDVNSEMIVLGACHTGSGKLRTGEGAISIARAFLYAGAKSVVMAVWALNDNFTNPILASFYENLTKGDNKAIALQKAKKDYIQTMSSYSAHPGYWAGLTIMGDTVPLESPNHLLYFLLLLVPVLIILAWIAFRRKKKKQYFL